MQTPEGFEYAVVSTEFGNYQVDENGQVTVDSCAVPPLLKAGFIILGIGGGTGAGAIGGFHTVTADDVTATEAVVATGLASYGLTVQIVRAGAVVTGDAAVVKSPGSFSVADGAADYELTAGDLINWMAASA